MELTALYRLYDCKGALLYVGISRGNQLFERQNQHFKLKEWFGDVANISLEFHPTRRGAKKAESEAIKIEAPIYNIAENPGHVPPRATRGRAYKGREMPAPCRLTWLRMLTASL